ncbi:MAG: hypothetical protein AAFW76_06380 [Pseudomonadota bacterium]
MGLFGPEPDTALSNGQAGPAARALIDGCQRVVLGIMEGAFINPGAQHRRTPEPVFPTGVSITRDVLQAATATPPKMRTRRLNPIRARVDDAQQSTNLPAPTLLYLNLDQVPRCGIWHSKRVRVRDTQTIAQAANPADFEFSGLTNAHSA